MHTWRGDDDDDYLLDARWLCLHYGANDQSRCSVASNMHKCAPAYFTVNDGIELNNKMLYPFIWAWTSILVDVCVCVCVYVHELVGEPFFAISESTPNGEVKAGWACWAHIITKAKSDRKFSQFSKKCPFIIWIILVLDECRHNEACKSNWIVMYKDGDKGVSLKCMICIAFQIKNKTSHYYTISFASLFHHTSAKSLHSDDACNQRDGLFFNLSILARKIYI